MGAGRCIDFQGDKQMERKMKMKMKMGKRFGWMGAAVVWAAISMGCVADATDNPQSEAIGLRSDWVKGRPASFNYTLTRLCYCREEYRGPFLIQANRDQVLHAIRLTDEGKAPVPEAELQSLSIDSVLLDLEAKLRSDYHVVGTVLKTDFGFPIRVELDQNPEVYDDEFGIAIHDFRVADPLPLPPAPNRNGL
jgi:hypothetical protein